MSMRIVKKIMTASIGTFLVLCVNILVAPVGLIGGESYVNYFPFATKHFYGSAMGAPQPETLWLGVIADIAVYMATFFIIYRFSFRKKLLSKTEQG